MTEQEQQMIDDAIRDDTGVWFEMHGRIFNKARELERPKSNYLQQKLQRVINKLREMGLPVRIIALKPRQKGSTTYCGAIDYTMLRKKPTAAVIIGGQYSQTNSLWQMIQTYQKWDTFDWKNIGEINSKEGKWSHGSTLIQETANDSLAGIAATFQLIHATEVARWSEYGVNNAADVLSNLLKCAPLLPETVVVLESTAESQSGDFYNRFVSAVDGDRFLAGEVTVQPGQFVRVFAPWFEFADSNLPDHLTAEQKAMVEETLDKNDEYYGEKELIANYAQTDEKGVTHLGGSVRTHDVWEQLAWRRWAISEECKRDRAIFDRDYPHSWEDAFQKSGEVRFNLTGLKVQEKRLSQRAAEYGILEESPNGKPVFRPTDENEAQVIIFERPLPGRRYILPIDPMTGITQTGGKDPDYHSAIVLRAGHTNHAGRWHRPGTVARIIPCRWDIDVLESQSWRLARYYGGKSGCKIAVEINKDRGLVELFKNRGADLYQRELFNQREQKVTNAYGWETTSKTREMIIENIARAIREWDKDNEGIDIFCPTALGQLNHFIRKHDGRSEASAGWHDDDVLAIAIGLQLIDHATTYAVERGQNIIPADLREIAETAGRPSTYS
jgi:hypothetical protein